MCIFKFLSSVQDKKQFLFWCSAASRTWFLMLLLKSCAVTVLYFSIIAGATKA